MDGDGDCDTNMYITLNDGCTTSSSVDVRGKSRSEDGDGGDTDPLPVLLLHGFALSNTAGTYRDFTDYVNWIKQNNPNQIAISLNVDNGFDSTQAMINQIYDVYQLIQNITKNNESFANGYHLVGHSQGALILRSVVELYGLPVNTFVSLAGVHMGIYGLGPLSGWEQNLTEWELTNLFYTKTFQKSFSVANWWHDPQNRDRYLSENVFLPSINQELPNQIPQYKENLINIGSFHCFGSKDDGTVVPWISELFGFFDSNLNLQPMFERDVYINDTFGLQTLYKEGRLTLTEIDGIAHAHWLSNQTIFNQYILPLISK
ncbi:palmitoyl-protein thioesterase 2 [Cavenderia fasciculata]|uniref:Palmitoyl-protein thioesterase 2 n=1 Tax=Cavenderia fasciculata TaxID=261658 RepID=F4Q5F9_CACFS|nr:palmitoyl-protein thioesterase 2 [Cavenderia fasciculata]EGG17218.1 palmitoyl-protein thioesterase 2 [Cavenderia fasciculata]|eukprot:XP_004355702.1 palmitoyl-protein thioesterase 2 [Cavenderia fasciculata]